jgi:hypothetical protein
MRAREWAASLGQVPIFSVGGAIEFNAELIDQNLLHEFRTFAGQHTDGGGIAKVRAGLEDVAREKFGRIVVAAKNDSALRPE